MTIQNHGNRTLPVILLFFLSLAIHGCSTESTDPDVIIPPVEASPISGVLSREHRSEGVFQDRFSFWIDQENMGDITALRLGVHVDDLPEPVTSGERDGFEFNIAPEIDVLLFDAGKSVNVDLLAEGGDVRATAFFAAPTVDVGIISPSQDDQVSHDGINVLWRSDGVGTAKIRMVCLADDSSWETVTENDGDYRISAGNLAAFPKGPCSIEVLSDFTVSLYSLELGGGTVVLSMAGYVEVGLGD